MMRKLIVFISIAIGASACNLQTGSGNIITREREVADFHGINAQQGFEVDITPGPATTVKIEADDNLMEDIKVEVKDGILHISIDKNNLHNSTLIAHVTAPHLDVIRTSSAASVEIKGSFTEDENVSCTASSGSTIEGEFTSPAISASASSGSRITLSGRTKDFDAQASSGASVSAFNLLSEQTTAQASSGAQAKVHSSVMLKATASSGGSVKYKGNPTTNNSQSSGGGVSKAD